MRFRPLAVGCVLSCLSPIAQAAPLSIQPSVDPQHSLTGWTLAEIVMMQRGDIDAAYEALSQALKLSPHDIHLRIDTLHYAAMSGHQTEALDLARTLPADDISTLILAQEAIVGKNWNELRHVLDRDSHRGALLAVAAPALEAWQQAAIGKSDRALSLLMDASGLPETRRLYLLHAALVAQALPDPARATALFEKTGSVRTDPLSLQIVYAQEYGSWLYRRGQKAEAEDTIAALAHGSPLGNMLVPALQHAITNVPAPSTRTGLAILDLQLGLMLADAARQDNIPADMAIIMLRQSLYLDPSLTIARIMLADLLRENSHNDDALDVLEKIPSSSPFAALAAQERVDITIHLHDLPRQAQALQQALALNPGNPDYLAQLGGVQDQLAQHEEAITSYTQALAASSPRKATVWPVLIGRAMAYQEKGDWAHAQEDMRHALTLAPEEPEVLNFVGYADIEHGVNTKEAMNHLKHALSLQPGDASIQDSYAWALLKTDGDLDQALPLLIQSAEHAPNDPEIGYHLGVAYWYLGRKLEAQDQWNQALADSPQPQDRVLIMKALQDGPHLAAFERTK